MKNKLQTLNHHQARFVKISASLGILLVAVIYLVSFYPVNAINTQSVLLNGSSQYLFKANATTSALNITGDFTIETWVKLASQPTADPYTIVAKFDGSGSSDRSYLVNYDSGGNLGCGVSQTGGGTSVVAINQSLSNGTWYHVAAVYSSATGNCQIFVNGSSIGSGITDSGGPFVGAAPFTIGFMLGNNASFLDGKLDDVRVYNVARTQSDIQSDYLQELNGDEVGLIAYWKFTGDLIDSTSNGNTLSSQNGNTFSNDVPFSVLAPTINSFGASPSTIASGGSSQLSWNISGATSISINQGVGTVTGTSTSVSPVTTTTYIITATNQGYATSTASATITVSASPTAVRKSSSQSLVSSTVLQNDSQLSLSVEAGKTYIIEGLVIASSTSAMPDIKIAFVAPTGTTMSIGYIEAAGSSSSGGILQASGIGGRASVPANNPAPIVIHGTIVVSTTGTLQLQWAQNTSNANTMQVVKGSYLKIDQI